MIVTSVLTAIALLIFKVIIGIVLDPRPDYVGPDNLGAPLPIITAIDAGGALRQPSFHPVWGVWAAALLHRPSRLCQGARIVQPLSMGFLPAHWRRWIPSARCRVLPCSARRQPATN